MISLVDSNKDEFIDLKIDDSLEVIIESIDIEKRKILLNCSDVKSKVKKNEEPKKSSKKDVIEEEKS